MVALNNSLTNEDLKNLKQVNTSALLENVREHGNGNTYTSPTYTSSRLNDLPIKQKTPTRKHRNLIMPSTPKKKTYKRRRNNNPRTPKRKPNTNNPIAPPAPKKSKKV